MEAAALALYDSHSHALDSTPGAPEGVSTSSGTCLMSTGEADWPALLAGADADGTPTRIALGTHPWFVHEQREGWQGRLRAALLARPDALVGETGIDRARRDAPWEAQLEAFACQLRMGAELGRPVVVHAVRADGALLDLLRAEADADRLPPVVVMHAFGGSAETAAAIGRIASAARSRAYFGFSGRRSPSPARRQRAAAVIASLPAERLLIESDAHADARPALVASLEALAEARGWSLQEAAERTAANARGAFDPATWVWTSPHSV